VSEAIEKLSWLLANPLKAKEIADAGRKRTVGQHTYLHRAQELIRILKK
jgi:spore maturation protein CgeB